MNSQHIEQHIGFLTTRVNAMTKEIKDLKLGVDGARDITADTQPVDEIIDAKVGELRQDLAKDKAVMEASINFKTKQAIEASDKSEDIASLKSRINDLEKQLSAANGLIKETLSKQAEVAALAARVEEMYRKHSEELKKN